MMKSRDNQKYLHSGVDEVGRNEESRTHSPCLAMYQNHIRVFFFQPLILEIAKTSKRNFHFHGDITVTKFGVILTMTLPSSPPPPPSLSLSLSPSL